MMRVLHRARALRLEMEIRDLSLEVQQRVRRQVTMVLVGMRKEEKWRHGRRLCERYLKNMISIKF